MADKLNSNRQDDVNVSFKDKMDQAVQWLEKILKTKTSDLPSTCIVLGSGLAPMTEKCEIIMEIPYKEIPHFPLSTVPGHDGLLLVAKVGNKVVYMMKGRFHYYEGYTTQEVTFPIRVLAKLGLQNLILTNAAGGVDITMKPGDLMIIKDHISVFCPSPLRGANLDDFGPRFPDQTQVYDLTLIEDLKKVASDLNIPVLEGVYSFSQGPQFETPSEIKMARNMGAHAVGMSTVPEAIVASHCGIKVVGISCITNLGAGITGEKLTHQEVMETGALASAKSIALVEGFLAIL